MCGSDAMLWSEKRYVKLHGSDMDRIRFGSGMTPGPGDGLQRVKGTASSMMRIKG